jgi:hypothetical protein
MKIPYGIADFRQIREEGFFYADKTPFLPLLESAEMGYRYLLFLRPRRFGKSTLVSMMEHYYDLAKKEQFDELFRGLWIHEHPTPERNSYLVLTLDFSGIGTDADQTALQRGFLSSVRDRVRDWVLMHREVAPEVEWLTDRIDGYESPEELMGGVLHAVQRTGRKLYLLIDEYDHFANRLLSTGDQELYDKSVADRTGFVRTFYAKLKSGTQTGAIKRMFVTGVSPLVLDDLSSGFNIASNASQDPALNALAGFTRADTERAVDELLAFRADLVGIPALSNRTELLGVLEGYYNGYRFAPQVSERIFNSDMVLYFLSQLQRTHEYPTQMLDHNVRTEYRHLQRIGTLTSTATAERRALLESIMSNGYIESSLVQQFGISSLSSDTQFISLLYYIGMLTLGAASTTRLIHRLEVPNRVIRDLQWEHLASMLKEQAGVTIDALYLEPALVAMGVHGNIQPFLDLFHERVIRRLGVKDARSFDEKALKLMLMTYLSLSRTFHVLSEKEFAQGYCDLFVGAEATAPGARFSWLLELKYLKTNAKPAAVEAAFAEAEEQVERYASDKALLPLLLGNRQLKAGTLVFVGMKSVEFRPWPRKAGAEPTVIKTATRTRTVRRPKAAAKRGPPARRRA